MPNNKAIQKIKKSERILLLTHEDPDGDALGSILALNFALKKIGKNTSMISADDVSRPFIFLPHVKEIKNDFLLGDYDLVIILDCGDLRRTGFGGRLKEFAKNKKKIINIDHHPKNDLHRIASLNMVDYHASSASEIIYDLISDLKIEIDRDIATCLLCGLYTDTGAFKHSNTSSKVLNISSILLKKGANLKKISDNITNGKSVSALKLWGLAFSRIQRNYDLGLVCSFITENDIKNCFSTYNDLGGVVNMINSIPGTNAAILFYEVGDGKIKASIRTESDSIDVSRLAKIFGGGGLKKASGFTVEGRLVSRDGKWMIE